MAEEDENVVFVGNKSPMNYVLAVMTQFRNGAEDVRVKARGRAISRAVDVAEITRNRFMEDTKVDSIDIGTEELEGDEGEEVNVSTMEITLTK